MVPSFLQKAHQKLLNNQRPSFLEKVLLFSLYSISLIFKALSHFRSWAYEIGLKKTKKINCVVISIGNISVGGTGKTPFCLYLLNRLVSLKLQPALIARGYGKDESILYQETFPQMPMAFDANRVAAAEKLLQNQPQIDVIVLDDAFQHQRIQRQINIVLLHSENPFGFGYHLPRGTLRESPKALKRANIICLTHANKIPAIKIDEIKAQLKQYSMAPILLATHEPHSFIFLNHKIPLEEFAINAKNKKIAAFCGIAFPTSFQNILEDIGLTINHFLGLGDHTAYDQKLINKLLELSKENEILITTEKDLVKIPKYLQKELNLYALSIELKISDEENILEKMINEARRIQ